uniref:Uncharacterized protein LOC107261312 n=1 Tax=Rhizophora mucronata TaxID=61149 RepID=A0A2P2JGI9_RHIMU
MQIQLFYVTKWFFSPLAPILGFEVTCFIMKLLLVLALLLISQLTIAHGLGLVDMLPAVKSSSAQQFWPAEPTTYWLIGADGGSGNINGIGRRRKLAPFQLCLLCKCCAAGAATTCANMPCCFGIDCQLPNKPYGVCAFVPKACNCTACV